MRLEFEPNATAFPLVADETFDELTIASDFQTILKNGIAAAQNGDRDQARVLLVKAAAYEPRSEDAWMWLASISEYPEELLAFLNNVLNINPENERALEWRAATKALLAKTLVQRGVSSHNEGKATLAAQCFEQALVHDGDCEMAWFWKASLAADDEQQVDFLNKVLSLNSENADAQQALDNIFKARARASVDDAKSVAGSGDVVLALEMLNKALAVAPDNADGWLLKSHLSNGIQDKLDALAKALEYAPDNAAARSSYDFLSSTVKSAVQTTAPDAPDGPVEAQAETLALTNELESAEHSGSFSEPENVVSGDTEDFTLTLAVTEDHEVELSPLADETKIPAEDFAYTQTVAFTHEPALDPTELAAPADTAFISSATLGQKELTAADPIHITEEPVEAPRSVEELFGPVDDHIDADRDTADSLSPWDEIAEPAAEYDLENSLSEMSRDGFTLEETPVFYEAAEQIDELAETPSQGESAVELAVDEPTVAFTAEESHERFVVEETETAFDSYEPSEGSGPADVADNAPQFTPLSAPAATPTACPFCWEPNEPQAFECVTCHASLSFSDVESVLANQRGVREVIQHAVTQMEAEWNLREFDQREMTTLALGHFNLQNYDTAMNYLQEASRLNPNDVILAGQLNTLAIRLNEIRRQGEVIDTMPKGKTILVVDDSATVRKLISGKLEKAGHAVVCAVDGVEGLARIEEQVPDLVLLDITMPRMDGYEVCKQIRSNALAKHVPVVMISGKDGFFDKVRGRIAGTTGYITKPFGPETLMKALETYLVSENGSGE